MCNRQWGASMLRVGNGGQILNTFFSNMRFDFFSFLNVYTQPSFMGSEWIKAGLGMDLGTLGFFLQDYHFK